MRRLSETAAPALVPVGEHDIPDARAHGGVIEAGIARGATSSAGAAT